MPNYKLDEKFPRVYEKVSHVPISSKISWINLYIETNLVRMYSETKNSYLQSLHIELSRNVENCAKIQRNFISSSFISLFNQRQKIFPTTCANLEKLRKHSRTYLYIGIPYISSIKVHIEIS